MELSRAEWATHVEDWRQSGETVTQYCEARGLKVGTLRYWSGRIKREAAGESGVTAVRFASVRRTRGRTPTPTSTASGVRMKVGGVEVELRVGFDEATLSRALDVVMTREASR